jgi:hypothetical protein
MASGKDGSEPMALGEKRCSVERMGTCSQSPEGRKGNSGVERSAFFFWDLLWPVSTFKVWPRNNTTLTQFQRIA